MRSRIYLGVGGANGFGSTNGFGGGNQNKYNTKYNDNPPPGYYQPDDGYIATKPRSRSAFMNNTGRVPSG